MLPRRVQQWSGSAGGLDMATVIDRHAVTTVGRGRRGEARPWSLSITLADLIIAIQDVVGPEDDGLVVATVRHLLGVGGSRSSGAEPAGAPPAPGAGVVAHGDRRGKAPERRGTPVALLALLPASRWRRSAGGCWEVRRSITGEEVKRYGRAFVRCRLGRGAGGAGGASGSRPLRTKGDQVMA